MAGLPTSFDQLDFIGTTDHPSAYGLRQLHVVPAGLFFSPAAVRA